MKVYQKPSIDVFDYSLKEQITSLSTWLTQNELQDAGITTYVINS